MKTSDKTTLMTKKIAIAVGGGGFYYESISLLKRISKDFDLVIIIPSDSKQLGTLILDDFPDILAVHILPAVTNFSIENRFSLKIATMSEALYKSFFILRKEKPVAVIVLGSSIAIPIFIISKLIGIKSVFIESITRVNQISKTGKIIARLNLANRFYVQWPDLLGQCQKSIYKGTVL